MNKVVRKEIEDLIVSGRGKDEKEFDRMLDDYLQDKTEKDENEIGNALSDFIFDRFYQLYEVELALKHCFDGVKYHQGTNNQFGAGAEKERQQCAQCNPERLGAVGVVVD